MNKIHYLSVAVVIVGLALLSKIEITLPGAEASPIKIMAYGDAQIDTAQSKFGQASGLFDGLDDYLSIPDNDNWNFMNGDFTLEFWIRFSSISDGTSNPMDGYTNIMGQGNVPDDTWVLHYYKDSSVSSLVLSDFDGAYPYRYESAFNWDSAPVVDTWYHVAFVKKGSTNYAFLDGVSQSLTRDSHLTTSNRTGQLWIGASEYQSGVSLDGWLDDIKLEKGYARYTSDFSPPASALKVTANTVLLLNMDGKDGSTDFKIKTHSVK